MNCPACQSPLQPRAIEGVEVQVCAACEGVLVEVRRLVPLLEQVARPLAKVMDLDEPIEPQPDEGVPRACPGCSQTMTAFGYMGERAVTVDRCSDCLLIWADAGEIGIMAQMYGRQKKREWKDYGETKLRRDAEALASLDRAAIRMRTRRHRRNSVWSLLR